MGQPLLRLPSRVARSFRSAGRAVGTRARSARARRLFLAWVSIPAWVALLGSADLPRPSVEQWILEACGWIALGLVHASVAPDDWRGSPLWPPAILLGALAIHVAAVRFELDGSLLALGLGLGLGLGLALAAVTVVRGLHPWLGARIPVLVLTGIAAVGGRAVAGVPPALPGSVMQGAPEPAGAVDGPPIVVITVDTLRSDAAREMRSVRRLARRGSFFPRAMASSSWTVPSLATLWTGEPPRAHGAGRAPTGGFRGIRRSVPTLAEELGARGYATAAFVTNPFLARPRMGFRRGFGAWRHFDRAQSPPLALAGWPPRALRAGDARDVVDAALAWLDGAPRRSVLLWVHLFEPHLPYEHAPPGQRFSPKLVQAVRSGRSWYADVGELRRGYRREVAYADRQIARLLDRLEARGHFERGITVLTSDHGEEFFEHESLEHGHSHHGEVIDVPLLLTAPGVPVGERAELASLEDVAPTVRAIVGMGTDPGVPEREGPDVDLRGSIPPDRIATAEGNLYYGPERSLRTGSLRVIERRRQHTEVYDLAVDPGEHRPRKADPAERRRFRAAWAGEPDPARDPAPAVDVDRRRLRALGYAQ